MLHQEKAEAFRKKKMAKEIFGSQILDKRIVLN